MGTTAATTTPPAMTTATTEDGNHDERSGSKGYSSLLASHLQSNLRYRKLWSETSGAVGDLGTFIPIVIALTVVNHLDLGTTLLFTGVYNILTGLLFGVPMPVQPMKSIAAVALTPGSPLSIPQIMAAGITTSGLILALGVTGLMGFVHRIMPLPVVRGVQLSQGLSFGITAVKYVLNSQDFAKGKSPGSRPWLALDGKLLALVAFAFIVIVTGSADTFAGHCGLEREETGPPLTEDVTMEVGTDGEGTALERSEVEATQRRRRSAFISVKRLEAIPTAILVFLLGIVLAFIHEPKIWTELRLGPSKPHFVHISKDDWKTGFVKGAIPQIPVSILNSVIAVCKLSSDLFPGKKVTPAAVSTSVGLMNLVGCWLGAMPVCHGAGGLAGQWRFGAKSGAAVVFLGAGKVILSMVLGSSLVKVLAGFPIALLGVLLVFSGVELAMACRDQSTRKDAFVMMICTVVSLGSSNAALGFGCGLAVSFMIKARELELAPFRNRLKKAFLSSYASCCTLHGTLP